MPRLGPENVAPSILMAGGVVSLITAFSLNFTFTKIFEFSILQSHSLEIMLTLFFDSAGLVFASLVLVISSIVLKFSEFYMQHERSVSQFTSIVMLFVLSMILLIFSLNMVSLLLGWDGLGLVSYLLVIFYQNQKSNAAGMITALSNRLGDAAILIAIGMAADSSSWNFIYLVNAQSAMNSFTLPLLIILAALTKSAQIPFSAWLPAAMAAPTPVSALVHSSTLVTAGVYLLIRFSPWVIVSSFGLGLLVISIMTSTLASISALFEKDLKKVIALSTLSQLGLMMMTISLGFQLLSFFHLMTHATFKALIFVVGGKFIHSFGGSQDMRIMGSQSTKATLSATVLFLSSAALCGFPFLAGFYSKDSILDSALFFTRHLELNLAVFLAASLTAAYSIRVFFFCLMAYPGYPPLARQSDIENNLTAAMTTLSLLAMSSGAALSLAPLLPLDLITLPLTEKLIPLLATSMGVGLGLVISQSKNSSYPAALFLADMWFLPALSGLTFPLKFLNLNSEIKLVDSGWSELAGGQGAYSSLLSSGVLSVILLLPSSLFWAQMLSIVTLWLWLPVLLCPKNSNE